MRFPNLDDSHLSNLALQNAIKKLDHEIVGSAMNGAEAVEKYQSLSLDAVTLDFMLPDIDG